MLGYRGVHLSTEVLPRVGSRHLSIYCKMVELYIKLFILRQSKSIFPLLECVGTTSLTLDHGGN